MELIYFISGILTGGVVYGVVLLRHVKSSHTSLLESNQHSTNISSIRYADMQEKLDNMTGHMNEVKEIMEKDSYENLTKIKKRIGNMGEDIANIQNILNNDVNATEKNFNKAFTEIQTIKNNIKALGADPNFLNRY